MRNTLFYAFLGTVLFLYGLINAYIVWRGLQALPRGPGRAVFLIVMILLILAYPLARLGAPFLPDGLERALHMAGAYYLAVMVFAFFLILAIDLVRLFNLLVPFLPPAGSLGSRRLALGAFWVVTAITLALTIVGSWNARHPVVRRLKIHLDKPSHSLNRLNLVLLSDLHLGTLVDRSRLETIAARVRELDPDLILFAGDVFDEDISSLQEQNMVEGLARFPTRAKKFAIPGNHEYYSGVDQAAAYLRQAGVVVLRDSVALVDSACYVVGRDDRTLEQFGGRRKPLQELLAGIDRSLPVILLDHQPFHLDEAERAGVDLQLSGHTHHGQLIPFNLITEAVYELSWGYLRRGRTHYYVSCGAGTWGPPVRLGSRPEIVQIELTWGEQSDHASGANRRVE